MILFWNLTIGCLKVFTVLEKFSLAGPRRSYLRFSIVFFFYCIFLCFSMILNYHVTIFPFHIASIPFEILFQNNFIFFWMTKLLIFFHIPIFPSFLNFWMFPVCFYSIFRFCFVRLIDDMSDTNNSIIKPLETMWAVKYLLRRKQTHICMGLYVGIFAFIGMLLWGFLSSLPFLPLFVVHGESYDE